MTNFQMEDRDPDEVICCPEVLGRLLERYAPMVRAICAARLGCSQCDDVQQEAFLRVIKNCDRLRDARQLPSYLRTITKNLCRDRIRAKRSGTQWAQVEPDLFETLPERIAEYGNADEIRTLQQEIAALPHSLRHVLELFYFGRLDYETIADRTGLTVGAVGQRLSRARRRLRTALRAS